MEEIIPSAETEYEDVKPTLTLSNLPLVLTTTTTSDALVDIPPDLVNYFKYDTESGESGKAKFKCLKRKCKYSKMYNPRRGWRDFEKHLKTAHRINDSGKDSGSTNMTLEAPVENSSTSTRGQNMQLRKSTRVLLQRFDWDHTKSPTTKTTLCILCGHKVHEAELMKQSKLLKRQKINNSNTICRLLEISSSRTLNLFKESKYCNTCHKNIQKFAETFSALDQILQEISEWKCEVEELLLNNFNSTKSSNMDYSDKTMLADGRMEIVNALTNRRGREQTPQSMKSVQLKSKFNTEEVLAGADKYNSANNAISGTDSYAYGEQDSSSSETEEEMRHQQKKSQTKATKHGNREFKCSRENCERTFSNEGRFRQHIQVFHDQERRSNQEKDQDQSKSMKCDLCDAVGVETVFESRKARKEHRSRADLHPCFKNGVYTCEICSRTLTDIRGIKNHRRSHRLCDLTERNCPTCALKFSTAEELLDHTLLHKSETPFRCVLCQIVLISSVDLKRHMVLCHADAVGVIHRSRCEVPGCEKSFKNAHDLKRHVLKHRGEGLIKCTECDVYVDSESQMKLHKVSHSDEKKFQCDICGVHLKYMKGLKRHRKRHQIALEGGKFQYECKICSKSFESTQRLRRHEEIHSGLTNLCDICGKSFAAKQNLLQHYKTHFKGTYPTVKRIRVKRPSQNVAQNIHQQGGHSGGELLTEENFADGINDNAGHVGGSSHPNGSNVIANPLSLQTITPFWY